MSTDQTCLRLAKIVGFNQDIIILHFQRMRTHKARPGTASTPSGPAPTSALGKSEWREIAAIPFVQGWSQNLSGAELADLCIGFKVRWCGGAGFSRTRPFLYIVVGENRAVHPIAFVRTDEGVLEHFEFSTDIPVA